ncbi:MAG TPA: tetratricopeptide repeat protein [Bacteroidia bacterium]|nr:tetratricopeptide repeat protein [Bacteroidia bacterium]QQR94628.1 MAG: tetratricopeptide repeat protein [Bacteroidota bacterium]MBP7714199.1 tetratricopeptide repeat protein [Bacteroidia bacterium]MBP8668149.1 tetratricopeptide repeat protein [Bacteroidia bacterium]HOZ89606.1 tetratricopeptide repeat protein [Bacteroidia bacterium]
MKHLWAIIVFLSLASSHAMPVQLDSLFIKANNYRNSDTVRATILNDLAIELADRDYEMGLLYSDSSIKLCHDINSDIKLATAYYAKARNLSTAGEDSLAIISYQKSYLLNLKERRFSACGTMLFNMGISYYNMSNYSQALEKYEAALNIFKKVKSEKGIAASLNSLGIVAMNLSDYSKAMEYYFECLKMAKNSDDSVLMANAYSNIGIVYKNIDDLSKALQYQNLALQINLIREEPLLIAKCYNNIAIVYSEMNQHNKAIEFYQKALEINREIKNNFGIASNYINIGTDLNHLNRFSEANHYMLLAEELFNKIGDQSSEAMAIKARGELILNAPDSVLKSLNIPKTQKYTVSLELLKRASAMFAEIGDISNRSDICQDLSMIYEYQGDAKNSLAYYKQHISLRDSVMLDNKKAEIERTELKFNFELKEKELNLINSKIASDLQLAEQKRKYLMMGSVLILLITGGGFVSYKLRKEAQQKRKDAEFKLANLNAELKSLRLQMNPHFMFNSLNSIADFIDKNESRIASNYTVKFAKLMRMILEYSEQQEITLEEELKLLELYLSLEALRINPNLSYVISVSPEIDISNILIPPMMVQPFVENSILHGIIPLAKPGVIKIDVSVSIDELIVIVEDNGVGINSSMKSDNKKSMAMKITKDRIALFNEQHSAAASVNLINLNQGTRIELRLPVIHRF